MEKAKLFDKMPDAKKIQLMTFFELYMKTQGSLPIDPSTLDVSNSSEQVAPKQKTLDHWLIKTPPKSTAATKESVQNTPKLTASTKESVQNTPNTQTGQKNAISSNSDQECQEINTNVVVQQPEKLYQNDLYQCNMNPIVIVKKLNLTGINLTSESSVSSVEVTEGLINASIRKEQINEKTSSDVKFSEKLIHIELQDNSNTNSTSNVEKKEKLKTIEENTEPCSSEFKITPNSLQKPKKNGLKIAENDLEEHCSELESLSKRKKRCTKISAVMLDTKKKVKKKQQVLSSSESISSKTNKEIVDIVKDDSVISLAGSSSNKVTDMSEIKETKKIKQKTNLKVQQTEHSTPVVDSNILSENEGSPLILNENNIENTLGNKMFLRRKSQSIDSSEDINTVEKSPIIISPQKKNTKELKQLVISHEDSLVTSENNSETFHSLNLRCLRSKRVFSDDTKHKSINEKLENQHSNNEGCEVTERILADDGLESKRIKSNKNKKLHDKNYTNNEYASNSAIDKINNSKKKKIVDEKANKNVNNFALSQKEKLPSDTEIAATTNDVNNCLSHEIKQKNYIKKERNQIQIECSASNCNISHAGESIEFNKCSVSFSNNQTNMKNLSSDCYTNAEYQTKTVSCKDTDNKIQTKTASFKDTDDKNSVNQIKTLLCKDTDNKNQIKTVSCKDTDNKNQKKTVSFKDTDDTNSENQTCKENDCKNSENLIKTVYKETGDKNVFLPKIRKKRKKNIGEQKSITFIKKRTRISKNLNKDSDVLKTCTTLADKNKEISPLSDKNFNQKKFKCSNIEASPENKINDIKETETKGTLDNDMNTSVMCDESTLDNDMNTSVMCEESTLDNDLNTLVMCDENIKNKNCPKNKEPFSEKQHIVDVNMSCSSPEIGFKKKVLKRTIKNRNDKNSVLPNAIDVTDKRKNKRKNINTKNYILTSSQDTPDQLSPKKTENKVINESQCNKKDPDKNNHSLTSGQVIFDPLPPNDNDMKQFQYNSYCKIKKICSAHGLALDDIFQKKEFKDMIEKYRNNPGAVLFIGTQKCPTTGRCEPIVSVHKSKKQLLEISPGIQPKK